MKIGICKLCGETKEIVNSHIIPKAAYKRLLAKSIKSPHPMMIENKTAPYQTSRQHSEYMLCKICENIIKTKGEDYILKNVFQVDGTCSLLDLLKRRIPADQYDGAEDISIYQIKEIDWEKIKYFALSVLWRASVAERNHFDSFQPLPINYNESLRQSLLGYRASENFYVRFSILKTNKFSRMIFLPSGHTDQKGFYKYGFFMNGCMFQIEGPLVTNEFKIGSTDNRVLFCMPVAKSNYLKDALRFVRNKRKETIS